VSECWSRRWVIQWALSNNLWEMKIIFYCSRSEVIHNKMLLEWWRKATLCKDTECCHQTPFVTFWSEMPWILKLKVCACWYKDLSVQCRVNQ
jgi:hypothetical protein